MAFLHLSDVVIPAGLPTVNVGGISTGLNEEIRCQFIILMRKSGVSSSFLPEKMNRHRAKKLGRGG